jgi:hypothetical protein
VSVVGIKGLEGGKLDDVDIAIVGADDLGIL